MGEMKGNIVQSADMGFKMGGLAGVVLGIISAIRSRRMMDIPISGLMMGGMFACIGAISSVIRSEEIGERSEEELKELRDFLRK